KEETMSPEELTGLEKLQQYVDGFVPARCVDRAVNPIFDAKGNERVEKRVINTKKLLGCKSAVKVKICLDNMYGFAERMLKLAVDKKKAGKNKAKGRTSAILSQSGPGSSSSPGGGHACSSEPKE
ncbi:hypothetical protein A2U01_0050745, partial [Trifolium medium]|nr:hypothetical protein [Trifolium medium]